MSFILGSYHYLQKKSPITSQILLLKIYSLELNRAIFICLNWWFVANDNKQIKSSIISFALQKSNQTNQKPLTKTERILYWWHCYACGSGSNTWTASSVGAAGRVAAVAPHLERLQKYLWECQCHALRQHPECLQLLTDDELGGLKSVSAWLSWQKTQDLLRHSWTFFKVGNLRIYHKSNGYYWRSEVPRQSVSIKQLKSDRGSHFHVSCSSYYPYVIYNWVKRVWEPQLHSCPSRALQGIVGGCSSKALFRVAEHYGPGFMVGSMNRPQTCRVPVCSACCLLEFIALNLWDYPTYYIRWWCRYVKDGAHRLCSLEHRRPKTTFHLSNMTWFWQKAAFNTSVYTTCSVLLDMKSGLLWWRLVDISVWCLSQKNQGQAWFLWEFLPTCYLVLVFKQLEVKWIWAPRGTVEAQYIFTPQKATCWAGETP